MKTRNGFVSNSSTTSFIVYGFYITLTNTIGDIYELCNDFKDGKVVVYFDETSGGYYIGKNIFSMSDEQGVKKISQISTDDLVDFEKKFKEYFYRVSNLDIQEPFALYGGVVSS